MHGFISFPPHMGHLPRPKSLQSMANPRNNVRYGHSGGELKPSIALESISESHLELTSRTPTSQEKSTISSKTLALASNVQMGSGASCLTLLQLYLHDLC